MVNHTSNSPIPEGYKRCSKGDKCAHLNGPILPLIEFGKRRQSKDNLDCYCKACQKERARLYRIDNPEKSRASYQKYRESNRDKVRAASRKSYFKHREKQRERRRIYYAKNVDKLRTRSRQWRSDNRDRALENLQRWRSEHVEWEREYRRHRYWSNPQGERNRSRQWRLKNPEKVKEINSRSRLKHKESRHQYSIRWHDSHRKHTREYARQYRLNNPKKTLESSRRWKANNRERVRQYKRIYKASNQEQTREIDRRAHHKRRALKRSLPSYYPPGTWVFALSLTHGCCLYCGKQLQDLFGGAKPHHEHWIPLSLDCDDHPGHVPWNVIPSCSTCNLSKGSKHPETWILKYFGKRKGKQVLARVQVFIASMRERYGQ